MQLVRVISTPEGVGALIESPEVVGVVVDLVGNQDESVAAKAVKFLSKFGQSSFHAASTLLFPTIESHLDKLKQIMNKSDILRYRVYEVGNYVNISIMRNYNLVSFLPLSKEGYCNYTHVR